MRQGNSVVPFGRVLFYCTLNQIPAEEGGGEVGLYDRDRRSSCRDLACYGYSSEELKCSPLYRQYPTEDATCYPMEGPFRIP